jgi:menaquinone-dependent protoporphyrinogen oxidase
VTDLPRSKRRLLLVYGTTDGQTRKIGDFITERLYRMNWSVTMLDAVYADDDLRLHSFDATIVAASVHVGKYQAVVVEFARRHHKALNEMHAAFVSVSLSAAGDDATDRHGLDECVAAFKRDTGWTPKMIHHSAGAFRWGKYAIFKHWALKYVAWRKAVRTDTAKDLELTDWDALAQFVDLFLKQ